VINGVCGDDRRGGHGGHGGHGCRHENDDLGDHRGAHRGGRRRCHAHDV